MNSESIEVRSIIEKLAFNFAMSQARIAPQPANDDDKVWIDWYNEYLSDVSATVGKKYIKLLHRNSVVGFIVNVSDDSKFRYGDMLKAASHSAPARNKPRGNVFLKIPNSISWTGF